MSDANLDLGPPMAEPPPLRFWQQGRLGRANWWHYFLSLPLILMIALLGAFLVAMVMDAHLVSVSDHVAESDWRGQPLETALLGFCRQNLPFVFLLLAVILVTKAIHARTLHSLVTGQPRFRWLQMLASLAAIPPLFLAATAVRPLWSNSTTTLAFDPLPLLLFLPFILVLVPIQVLSEEVFFRGYLVQAFGRFVTRPWLAVLLPGLLFWVGHLEAEMLVPGGIWTIGYYAVLAFYLTYLALAGNGLEHALGVHLGVNLYFDLIQGFDDGYQDTPALLFSEIESVAPVFLETAVVLAVHYFLVFRPMAGGRSR